MALTSSFFSDNRRRFADRLPDNTVVYLFAGEARRMSGDTDYRFLPDRNFYYMTGLERAGLILVIEKKAGTAHDILYAPAHDKIAERWGGKRPDFESLSAISGIEDVRNEDLFDEEAMAEAKDGNTGLAVDGSSIMEAPRSFTDKITTFGVKPANIAPIITDLRLIKGEDELDCIRQAAKITEEAIAELKPYVKPGITEYELYTRLEYEMARRGSLVNAFETIVSCGTNAFYLHHADPEKSGDGVAQEGSVIQIDVGARCQGYCADISRVFFVGAPAEGDRRVALHGIIRRLRQEAFSYIAPGRTFAGLNSQMYDICGRWLAAQGLISDNFCVGDVQKYYWHNTSHYLGLDVHDTGPKDRAFTEGNCLAVEPGIYIPEWGIGFRIEDDVVVTSGGCELLSSGTDELEGIIAD
ncbi:MAG: aminopeptidase P family protein [Clostridiales bacterium]|nr:aminopeptidase P family protein [Clostridiales bacterium]